MLAGVGARIVAIVLTVAFTVAASCTPSGGEVSAAGNGAEQASQPEPLPQRLQAVARADALAERAVASDGDRRAELLLAAARIRQRIWRIDRRRADGLEALELLSEAARDPGERGCFARVERGLLSGEMEGDPRSAYEALLRATQSGSTPCLERARLALDTLAAYRPAARVVAAIEREGRRPQSAGGAAPRSSGDDPANAQVVSPQVDSAVARDAIVSKIERYAAEDSARIVVYVSAPTTYRVGHLEASEGRGPRLYVDIAQAAYSGERQFSMDGLVEAVRVGSKAGGTRIVFDLRQVATHRVFYLPEPFRLVVDLTRGAAPGGGAGAGERPLRRVVIDPGHGGHDPGATGPSGLLEKDVTLDIAHRAAPLIAQELGISTLLTRDTDVYVPLDERAARANAFRGDLFISVHCNASESPSSRGVMTFVLDESRDAVALSVAARENSASAAAATELANALSRTLSDGFVQQSVHFAELLQRASVASLGLAYEGVRDQGAKRAGFYVLAGAQMPAVLYEVSFISNPREELRLNTADYRQRIADALVNAVRAYREGL